MVDEPLRKLKKGDEVAHAGATKEGNVRPLVLVFNFVLHHGHVIILSDEKLKEVQSWYSGKTLISI